MQHHLYPASEDTRQERIVIPKIFDATTLRLNDCACYVTIKDGPATVSGSTATHSAIISELLIKKHDDSCSLASGYITVKGRCNVSDGDSSALPCEVTLPFSVLLRYPKNKERVQTVATVSFDFIASKNSDGLYNGSASGVAMISVCTDASFSTGADFSVGTSMHE